MDWLDGHDIRARRRPVEGDKQPRRAGLDVLHRRTRSRVSWGVAFGGTTTRSEQPTAFTMTC